MPIGQERVLWRITVPPDPFRWVFLLKIEPIFLLWALIFDRSPKEVLFSAYKEKTAQQ